MTNALYSIGPQGHDIARTIVLCAEHGLRERYKNLCATFIERSEAECDECYVSFPSKIIDRRAARILADVLKDEITQANPQTETELRAIANKYLVLWDFVSVVLFELLQEERKATEEMAMRKDFEDLGISHEEMFGVPLGGEK